MGNLKELKAAMEAAAITYASKYNSEERVKKSELKKLKSASDDAVSAYNLELSQTYYRMWNEEGDAVRTAIRYRNIPNAKKVSFKTDDDDRMTVSIVDNDNYPVNLFVLQATVGITAFTSVDWFVKVERLASVVATRISKELECGDAWVYATQNDISCSGSFRANPYSDAGIIAALQECMDAICFIASKDDAEKNVIQCNVGTLDDGSVYSPEWRIIRESMTRNCGCNRLAVCNTAKMASYIVDAMHALLTLGELTLVVE